VSGPIRPELRAGDTVTFQGRKWQVVGLGSLAPETAALQCWLCDDAGAILQFRVAELLAAEDFQVANGPGRLQAPQLGLLVTVSKEEGQDAYAWERHLREVEWGLPAPGAHGPVRACFDPSTTTLGQRIEAKAQQLQSLGFKASVATIRRMRDRYRDGGVWGLVPQKRQACATGRADAELVEAIRAVLREEEFRSRSRGWKTRLRRQVTWRVQEAEKRGGPHIVVPPPSTFNKLVTALEDKRLRGKNMAQRRWWSARPKPPFRPTIALRPGELVMMDSTPLDVLIVLEDGSRARPELTMACARLVTDRVRCAGDAEIWLDGSLHQPRRRPARCWAVLAA
jgi:hypothetical protein